MADPVSQFDSLLASSDFLFVVSYRGHWCPFCMSYLTTFHKLESNITSAHGTPLIVTAEPEVHLAATRAASGYAGLAIVDTENLLAIELKARKLVDVVISEKAGYDHGMAQPAVLVVTKDGKALESWAIKPSLMNLGGAKDRPDLNQIWENVEAKLKGGKTIHKSYKTGSALGVIWKKVAG